MEEDKTEKNEQIVIVGWVNCVQHLCAPSLSFELFVR